MLLLKASSCFPASPYLVIPAPHLAIRYQSLLLSALILLSTSPTKKSTHCLTGLPLDLIYQVALWLVVDKRENVGTHNPLSGNVVSNCETTLYFRTNLSSTIICCSNIFGHSTFGSLVLCWIWLLFFHPNG